jgi:hypothetical protein
VRFHLGHGTSFLLRERKGKMLPVVYQTLVRLRLIVRLRISNISVKCIAQLVVCIAFLDLSKVLKDTLLIRDGVLGDSRC